MAAIGLTEYILIGWLRTKADLPMELQWTSAAAIFISGALAGVVCVSLKVRSPFWLTAFSPVLGIPIARKGNSR
jgi:hypothetical protein